ncbi:DnaA ATPase domain-containing protein [Streptococcus uberis]|uniref:DnaA ATPase domain-containing protein n=1 Tax=Streptococcus uberis TaxID=1349 RepID=UPI000E00A9C3|nr:DnaA/Hda family protein [Streptococcus uberis]SUO90017.1 chromosomal replication initiator protein dnaA [Streptococcus uberis]
MKLLNKNQTFENFSVNDRNAWAFAALKTVIADKNYFNPVYIYGEEGVGKSHLLNATNNALLSEQNKVILLTAESLTYHLVENLTNSEFDYILIDDLNLMPKDDILEEQLAMLIEENKKQLVITSTVSPNSLEVSSKLQKRLQWGLTTSIVSRNQ